MVVHTGQTVKHGQTTNCLTMFDRLTSVFDHFVRLALKGLKLGGIHLKKFIPNSRDVLKEISSGNLSTKIVYLDQDKVSIENTLRVSWDPNSDMLTFKVVNKDILETKRGIFSMFSSIFARRELSYQSM